jgi:hypothetical protein
MGSRDNSVGTGRATCWTAEESGFRLQIGERDFSPHRLQGLPSWYRGLFPRVSIDRVFFHEMVLNLAFIIFKECILLYLCIFIHYFPSQHNNVKNSLTFIVYNEFISLNDTIRNVLHVLAYETIIRECTITTFFLNWNSGGWSPIGVHSALRPPIGLLHQPRVIMMTEKLVEWRLAGETEVLGENLPQCYFVHHKPNTLCPDKNPGRRSGKPATNRLSCGTAQHYI